MGGILYCEGKIEEANGIESKGGSLSSFTGSPSRKLFPRGFLWDDGFHNILICKIDKEICKEILKSWLSGMDENGWIPREQVRGEEIKEMVPKEFVSQDAFEANPPTYLMPILQILKEGDSKDGEFL